MVRPLSWRSSSSSVVLSRYARRSSTGRRSPELDEPIGHVRAKRRATPRFLILCAPSCRRRAWRRNSLPRGQRVSSTVHSRGVSEVLQVK
jgi:hypothetical protein